MWCCVVCGVVWCVCVCRVVSCGVVWCRVVSYGVAWCVLRCVVCVGLCVCVLGVIVVCLVCCVLCVVLCVVCCVFPFPLSCDLYTCGCRHAALTTAKLRTTTLKNISCVGRASAAYQHQRRRLSVNSSSKRLFTLRLLPVPELGSGGTAPAHTTSSVPPPASVLHVLDSSRHPLSPSVG